jgi:hypothetical protein
MSIDRRPEFGKIMQNNAVKAVKKMGLTTADLPAAQM